MKIAIIGSDGVVGKVLVEHLRFQCNEVVEIDRNTDATIDNALADVQVVFIATLPLHELGGLVSQVIERVSPGTLLVNCASIESLTSVVVDQQLMERQVTLCHMHFHFRPEVPLRRTLFGQSVSVSYRNNPAGQWSEWLQEQFGYYLPRWLDLPVGVHDQITQISQLVHMVSCLLTNVTCQSVDERTLQYAIDIGGPPFRLLLRSVLRVGETPAVTSSILRNHPHAADLMETMELELQNVQAMVEQAAEPEVITRLASLRQRLAPAWLRDWDQTTDELLRLEADLGACQVEFHFTAEQNQPGLLVRVLTEFGKRNVDMTTTIAQVNPDGGCIIRIGVRQNDTNVAAAKAAVQSW